MPSTPPRSARSRGSGGGPEARLIADSLTAQRAGLAEAVGGSVGVTGAKGKRPQLMKGPGLSFEIADRARGAKRRLQGLDEFKPAHEQGEEGGEIPREPSASLKRPWRSSLRSSPSIASSSPLTDFGSRLPSAIAVRRFAARSVLPVTSSASSSA